MHVFITGASSGIGESLAKEFSKKAEKLTLIARRKDRLETLSGKLKAKINIEICDLSDPQKALAAYENSIKLNGNIDILVNNAGMTYFGSVLEMPRSEMEKMINLNYVTPMLLMGQAAKDMSERKSGSIINISSVSAKTPLPILAVYSSTKIGLSTASDMYRAQLKKFGVHVLTVYPGPIHTEMEDVARSQNPGNQMMDALPAGEPDMLARLIIDAIEKKKNELFYPGIYGAVDVFPAAIKWLTEKLG